eukprot:PLAT10146.2.p1 GENE.PLAT10146.2~~PLAT10146.2.p1  ORF type:complete len:158 (+),score=27.15 PLAT10146.2:34-474(+)
MADSDGFCLLVNGAVESAEMHGSDNLYCMYAFSMGPDWKIISSRPETGISQTAKKTSSTDATVVWNFPIEVAFQSTNPFGWPRIVVTVYSVDGVGRDVVQGYGTLHVPVYPGSYTKYVELFAPQSSSLLEQLLGWLAGAPAEVSAA